MENATTVTLTLAGVPIYWKRPGLNGRVFYDRQKKERLAIRAEMLSQYDGPLLEGPLVAAADFYFPCPEDWSPNKKLLAYAGLVDFVSAPDIDNLCKWVFDCMTGVVYRDDRFIVSIASMTKQYDPAPRTEITVSRKIVAAVK